MPTKPRPDKHTILKVSKQYSELVRESPPGSHSYVVFLGLRSFDTPGLLNQIDKGLSYTAFEKLQKYIDVSLQELAELLQISVRTLNRRKKEKGRFDPDESDRLVRLARIFGRALELYEGDYELARDWLSRHQMGLGGARPLDLVKSEVGAREVEALIGRLEHGVIS